MRLVPALLKPATHQHQFKALGWAAMPRMAPLTSLPMAGIRLPTPIHGTRLQKRTCVMGCAQHGAVGTWSERHIINLPFHDGFSVPTEQRKLVSGHLGFPLAAQPSVDVAHLDASKHFSACPVQAAVGWVYQPT